MIVVETTVGMTVVGMIVGMTVVGMSVGMTVVGMTVGMTGGITVGTGVTLGGGGGGGNFVNGTFGVEITCFTYWQFRFVSFRFVSFRFISLVPEKWCPENNKFFLLMTLVAQLSASSPPE